MGKKSLGDVASWEHLDEVDMRFSEAKVHEKG